MAKILVIDDEPGICEIICGVLRAAGHEVVVFPNGRGAIKHIGTEPADLLITDIFMPDVEGLETIRDIQHLAPAMPIIAMSGVVLRGREYLRIAKEFGAVATLQKPFWPADLLELVSSVLVTSCRPSAMPR